MIKIPTSAPFTVPTSPSSTPLTEMISNAEGNKHGGSEAQVADELMMHEDEG